MSEAPSLRMLGAVPTYLLCHRHQAKECRTAFACWTGFQSPLRGSVALGSCLTGGHALWWEVEADSAETALRYLPRYVAVRTEAIEVRPTEIP